MGVERHVFKGKSVATFVTQDGQVINANIENLTISCDDGENDWGYITMDDLILPLAHTYSLEGNMVPITDTGIIFEIRRNT